MCAKLANARGRESVGVCARARPRYLSSSPPHAPSVFGRHKPLRCVGPRRQARTSVSGRRRRQAARNVSCEFSSPCERAWAAMRHAPATAKQSASLPHPTFPAAVAPPACRSQCARCRHAGHARVPARPRHLLLLHLCWPCVRRLWVLLPDATQTQTQTWQMPDATQAQSLNPKHSMIQPCSSPNSLKSTT